ncbi:MAG: 4-hydroxy-tetrahydrodipicolinate reductase [Candidatus Omnitrophica bacterium]|nr:4-hydroxy-tetrahydrodipicolinate reductase [Candidatus Omnitrophota bacterium]MCB9748265.1 4-hydroxy-tetrahydrodipicolinate reductase [Candidatus Omnitrophota bacterium]
MIHLSVSGCQGRMGQRITQLALADKDFKLTTLLEHPDHPKAKETIEGIKISSDSENLKTCDAHIEFTLPEGTLKNLDACVKHGVPMVIGTTGFSPEGIQKIKDASVKIPIVFASNMSVGVNLVFKLTQLTAQKCAQNYTMNIVETHHVHKKDAPSGTAKTIAEIAEQASGKKVTNIESIREGEVIGDHTISFESDEDIITITHHAKNRDIFAKGSLVAAKFLINKKPGLYDMQDVLNLK